VRHEVRERQHRLHAGRLPRRAGVDAVDQRVRMRAPHERRVQRAGELQVVDEPPAALQQRQVLDPLERLADDGKRPVHVPP
jgi:hypothetical protein